MPKGLSLRATLLRQAAQYSVGTFLGMFASIARAGIGAHYLSAVQMGSWVALQVIVGYAANLHFGTVFGMFRSVPIKLAQGDADGAAEEERTCFTFVLIVAVVAVVGCAAFGPRLAPSVDRVYLVEAVILAISALLKGWYVGVFKAERRFAELSASSAIGAGASIVGLLAIVRFGLDGLLGGMIAQTVVEMVVLGVRKHLPRLGLSKVVLFAQVRVGSMTLLTNLGVVAITTVERTVMLERLGAAATGLFLLGAQIAYLIPVIAAVPAGVLTPHLFERVAKGESLMPLVQRPILLLSYIFSCLIGVGMLALGPAVALLWPNLVDGNTAAKLALIGTLPMVLVGPVSNVYYAMDRQGPLVLILLLGAAVTYALTFVGVQLTGTIGGAAAGATVGLYLYYGGAVFGAFRLVNASTGDAFRLTASSLAPLLYALAIVGGCDFLLGKSMAPSSFLRAAIAEVVFLVAMAPWLWRALNVVRGRTTSAS